MKHISVWAPALKLALNGGRTFGQSHMRVLVKNICTRHVEKFAGKMDSEVFAETIAELCNISAFQQFLAEENIIDRAKRGKNEKVAHNLKELLK
jgi:hypothetical protein